MQEIPGTSVQLSPEYIAAVQANCDAASSAAHFVRLFDIIQKDCAEISKAHGFVEDNIGEKIALMHSELSEALEAFRHGNPPDSHIPDFTGAEAEFADTIIRIMVLAQARGLRVAEALIAKKEYNRARPFRHGNKQF